jgi:hypothetical protein
MDGYTYTNYWGYPGGGYPYSTVTTTYSDMYAYGNNSGVAATMIPYSGSSGTSIPSYMNAGNYTNLNNNLSVLYGPIVSNPGGGSGYLQTSNGTYYVPTAATYNSEGAPISEAQADEAFIANY